MGGHTAILVAAIVLFDCLVAALVGWGMVHLGWRPWAREYPPHPPAPDAVRRRFQSFRVGMMNLGGAIHVAVDEDHLHLTPVRVLRWIGMSPISVPWGSITIRRRRGRWVMASAGGRTL
jgi:hypothetical protein